MHDEPELDTKAHQYEHERVREIRHDAPEAIDLDARSVVEERLTLDDRCEFERTAVRRKTAITAMGSVAARSAPSNNAGTNGMVRVSASPPATKNAVKITPGTASTFHAASK